MPEHTKGLTHMKVRTRLLLSVLLLAASTAVAGVVPADDKNLQYTGRIDFTDNKAPVLSWPGSSIRTKFTGTSLKVKMTGDGRTDKKGKPTGPMFNVFIDGKFDNGHVFGCNEKGEHVYTIAQGLADKTHDLLITKRGGGKNAFLGLVLDDGATLEAPGPRPKLKMEVYGDSISVGLGADRKRGGEHSREATDNFISYGAITARNIGAEYHCISKSGIGLIKSWWPTIMPQYYDRADGTSLEGSGKAWDFSKWTPDLVVINIFQNDSWTRKKTTTQEGVSAYADFVQKIRGHYPKAKIVCVLGSMDASKGKWAGFVKKAVGQLNDGGDKNVHWYLFKIQTGYRHPNAKNHATMAQELTQFLTTLDMGITLTTPLPVAVTEVETGFTPDPSKTYYIDCPATGGRLSADGPKTTAYNQTFKLPKAAAKSETGANVQWKFVAVGDKWHIQQADGGENPRLRAVNVPSAKGIAMTGVDSSGGWTQFRITGASNGRCFITAPDGPGKYKRLSLSDGGRVVMTKADTTDSSAQLVVTEARGKRD